MAELKRSLNLTQLIFYGAGSMIGAGIYSVIGAAAGEAGNHLWLSFLLAGFAAFLTVLSYAELASALPKAGAEYQFLKKAFPSFRMASFMAGYLIVLNAAATSATVALAFAGYLNVFIEAPTLLTAFLLLTACTAVNVSGIRQSTWVSIILICIEIAGLLLIIAAGLSAGEITKSFESAPAWSNATEILSATALIFFIYIGFEDVANLSEESKDSKRNIPRALLTSVILTSVVYILVALSVMALSTPEALAGSDSPLTLAAGTAAPWMGQALAVAALFATSSTALISLISISRMLFGMARDGDMPSLLSRTHSNRKTPWVAALTLFGVACLFLPLGEVKTVASVSSFGVLIVFIGVHAAMIALRYREPDLKRSFHVPFAAGRLPLIPVLGILITLALLTQFEWIVYMIGVGAIAPGVLIYFVRRSIN
ncbi:MAG: amino acid permease [Alphaproteobacteria bacterium PRO2]|nr:amino acid permease [Alphaproteobacteria bacterium PRO2]